MMTWLDERIDDAASESDTVAAGRIRVTGLGRALLTSKLARLSELLAVFGITGIVLVGAGPLVGENPLARQALVWVTNVLMLFMVWLGLHLRGEEWRHFGLAFRKPDRRAVVQALLRSLPVFLAAVIAFVVGAVVMANLAGTPEAADMSGYNYLRGNLPLTVLALVAVYIVSSFGEEVIYRAFLINRIAELGSGGKVAWGFAIVLSSIVFGLVHFEWGVAGMVQTSFMGAALGLSYLVVRRNLWVIILAHAYMDTILILQMYFGAGSGAVS